MRDGLFLPLYPLAEWFASHWWFLRAEVEAPQKYGDLEFVPRHCIASAREGYALPRLFISPVGSYTKLQWKRQRLPRQGVEFLAAGTAHVSTEGFVDAVSELIQRVIARLEEHGLFGTLLQEEWRAVREAAPQERDFCRAAAALGEDPYDMTDELAAALKGLAERFPEELFEEFLLVASVDALDREADDLQTVLTDACIQAPILEPFREIREEGLGVPPGGDLPPWERGCRMADKLRGRLGLQSDPLPRGSELAAKLGLASDATLEDAVSSRPFRAASVDGIMVAGPDQAPRMVLHPRSEAAQRFHLFRGIGEYLGGTTPSSGLLSRANSERQKCNRAFAAEFLAPAEGLRQRVERHVLDGEDLEDLADTFGVSQYVIFHQVKNHGIAGVELGD